MGKIKLFTHTDLDGVGCAIVAKHFFGDNVDVEYCDYHIVNEKVGFFLDSEVDNYRLIYITDISVNEENAKWIDEDYGHKVTLIDHHDTAKWLNRYSWAHVKSEDTSGHKTCGTTLFLEHLYERARKTMDNYDVAMFAETVRRYDTWEWVTRYNRELLPKQLNDLLNIVGRDRFVERFTQDALPLLGGTELLLLEIEEEKIEKYIETKLKQINETKVKGKRVGVVFAERYISQLGDALANKHPELDIIAIVNVGRNSVSYRTVKDDIHLGEFAKQFGGGGHPKAAGSPLSYEIKQGITDLIFSKGVIYK